MKKIVILLLALVCVIAFAACGENETTGDIGDTATSSSSTETPTTGEPATNDTEVPEPTDPETTDPEPTDPETTNPEPTEHTHSYTAVVTAPTCMKKGYTTYTCVCGDSYEDDFVDMIDHNFGEWTNLKDATSTETGLRERTCTVCGEVEKEEIPATGSEDAGDLAGNYGKITLWVSETDGAKEQFEKQIAAFRAKYPNIEFTAEIEVISEADAASQVIADVVSAPDIYCFTQEQLTRLVQSAALSAPSGTLIDTIKAENSAASVAAASLAGTLYAYPMTADNGYYMYYDKSILSEEDVEDLATIVSKVEGSGKKIRFALENAWYTASFFYATGCSSTWSMNTEGKWTGVEDNWNSDNGLIAMKGMQILTSSSAYDSDADIFTDAAVVITGTWNSYVAANYFGDNLGATDLPSFTVDGKSYHLASYFGCKLMGVKPQSDAKKQIVLHLLAQYLTNEENQLARYESFSWGPSNLAAQENEAVKSNISLQALTKQNEYAVTQGNINGYWWDIAKLLGAEAKSAMTEQDLKDALKEYEEAINAVLAKTDDELKAWGIIGDICGTCWDTDFPMTEQDDGSYLSDELYLNVGEQFKVRQGGSWDVSYGKDGILGGENFTVNKSGLYYIRLSFNGDNAIIELLCLDSTEDDSSHWGIIGGICGTNWDTDFPMTEQEDGSYLSDVLTLNAGEMFKVRQGGSWDVNYGVDGVFGGDNIVVETAGKYWVKLTLGDTVTIELIPAN